MSKSKKPHKTAGKIVLRGGCGSELIPVDRVIVKKDKAQKAIDAARKARDDKDTAEAEKEAEAMKQHKAIRPDRQKLAF